MTKLQNQIYWHRADSQLLITLFLLTPNISDANVQIDRYATVNDDHLKKASHTAKTHESRTNYAHICVSAQSVRRMRNSSVDRTWTVIDCKRMCVKGGLCVILSFEWFKKIPTHNCAFVRVIHESACVVYASVVIAYASELVRNRALPLTPYLYITHEQRTYHVHSTDIRWLSLTKLTYASTCATC